MDERFTDEFVTWRHKTPIGVKIDEIFGMDSKSGKVWLELAKQIFSEQSDTFYRVIDHFPNGAPFLEGYPGRISVTHTNHFLAVASLPKTPEINLELFNPRAALGIDAESIDRTQVIKIREKFLSPDELEMIGEEDVAANILAWTIKEALYKAALTPGLDFKENLKIKKLPVVLAEPDSKPEKDSKGNIRDSFGEAVIIFPKDSEWGEQQMTLFSYMSYGCCVTIAVSPKCAKFGK